MLEKLFNPFSLSLLAFFPLVAWQGGFMKLAGSSFPLSSSGQLQRRVAAAAVSPAGWPEAPSHFEATTPANTSFPPPPAGREVDATPEDLMRTAQPTLARLQSLGAQYLRVERLADPPGQFRCYCELPVAPQSTQVRAFEAVGTDPQLAAGRVLLQIESLYR